MLHLKTGIEVERDFYTFIKDSAIGQTIKGSVYRLEERPDNATTEDVVIKLLSGMDSLLQTGIVICNIYVPDIMAKNGETLPDLTRMGELETAIHAFIDDFTCEDYYQIETDGTPEVIEAEGIAQHYIYTRFKFYRRAS